MSILFSILAGAAFLVPIQFKDLSFTHSKEEMAVLCSDAASYFNREYGQTKFDFTVCDIVSLEKSYTVYGKNSSSKKDEHFCDAAIEACKKLDPKTDFSKTDYLFFIVPGRDESDGAGSDFFWPQQSCFSANGKSLSLDGKSFDKYLLISELDSLGNFCGHGNLCHEFCHILGLQDYYDTDGAGSGGLSPGLWGRLALMDSGNKEGYGHTPPLLCAAEREELQIKGGIDLSEGKHSLYPLEEKGEYYRYIGKDGVSYFLECRKGSELMLSRIDKSENGSGESDYYKRVLTAAERWKYNEVNCRPGNECAKGSLHPSEDSLIRIDSLAITDITTSSNGVSFKASVPIKNTALTILQDGVFVESGSGFEPSEINFFKASIRQDGKIIAEQTFSNRHLLFRGLTPAQSYELTISVGLASSYLFEKKYSFKTIAARKNALPFIMFDSSKRNSDGTFRKGSDILLYVMNAIDALSIKWYFNGKELETESEQYCLKIDKSGELSAELTYSDRAIVIRKKINVR